MFIYSQNIMHFFKPGVRVQFIYTAVLVSGVQKSESLMYVHISTLF